MIRWCYAFVDRPYDRFDAAARFWTAVTATTLSTRRGARDEFATLVPADEDACVKLQGVATGAGGAHVDLMVDEVAPFVARALSLGASVTTPHEDWAVLASPAGQAFCVGPRGPSAGRRPGVVTGPGGTASRLDQVCVDVPAGSFEAEVAFWGALTGWDSFPGSGPEFHVVRPPVGLPVRLLLQRLGSDRPLGAHLDLACGGDVAAVRTWHESLGATFEATGEGWLVMRDPAGGVYCLTGRDAATGGRPG